MDRLLKQLSTVEGVSEFAVAVNVDIRGFSSFTRTVDSVDVAIYLRRFYQSLLDSALPRADFAKLTGDGVLALYRYSSVAQLRTVVNDLVTRSLKLNQTVESLVSGDDMIYFGIPSAVGVGLSRGSVSRLRSGRQTVDYAGRPLNAASRMMDLARPAGVVLDSTIARSLLESEVAARFSDDAVFVSGIAEDERMPVLITHEWTVIPAHRREPPTEPRFVTERYAYALGEWKGMGDAEFAVPLRAKPDGVDGITVLAQFPPTEVSTGELIPSTTLARESWRLGTHDGRQVVIVDSPAIVAAAAKDKTKNAAPVAVVVTYMTRATDVRPRSQQPIPSNGSDRASAKAAKGSPRAARDES